MISEYDQLGSNRWRESVKERAGWACERCGRDCRIRTLIDGGMDAEHAVEFFHTHHIDGDRSNNSLINGRALCRTCHRGIHEMLKRSSLLITH